MSSHHHHGHSHDHDHDGDHSHVRSVEDGAVGTPLWADTSVADSDLEPKHLSRRNILRSAGLLGAGTAALSVFGGTPAYAAAAPSGSFDDAPLMYLAGDHHMHTQFSSDGLLRVSDHSEHGAQYGLDWLVITDHGSVAHSKIGVDNVNPKIRAARVANPRQLLFQGLEWNIPAAEHATVFVAPGPNEVAVLKQFEQTYDGVVNNATEGSTGNPATATNEALAISGLQFLAQQKQSGVVDDALMLANHPARKGLDSPHEIRGWRDATNGIAIGMEGAPGHQAAGLMAPGAASGRGFYDNSPTAQSFAAYPTPDSYVTWGGFDWMTSTVGGLWDSLLAEGKPWWITANSDSHTVHASPLVRGTFPQGHDFNSDGQYPDPTDGGTPVLANGDFYPGFYSRTHVGVESYGYTQVMDGLRRGRVWVDHGQLIDDIDVRLIHRGSSSERGVTLGGTVQVAKGTRLQLVIKIRTAFRPNFNGDLPKLARVDVIRGTVTGPVTDRDTLSAPKARVRTSYDVSGKSGNITLYSDYDVTDESFYVRVRGTDGNRSQVGLNGAKVDPQGPAADVRGDADPWKDLWFYTNPIFVSVA